MSLRRRDQQLGSLRRRYTKFAIMVVTIVIVVSAIAYLSLRRTEAQAGHNLEVRSALSASVHGVRAGLVEAYKSLDLFLLEPTVAAHQERFDAALDSAAAHANILRATRSGWPSTGNAGPWTWWWSASGSCATKSPS